jgi:hypothetical protein
MCVHKEMIATCAAWCHMPLVSFPIEFVPSGLSAFSISGFGLFPWVPCLTLVPTKSNLPLTDNLYNLLRCRSLKNVFVSLVTWHKLDVDGPENYSSSPAEMTV